MVCRASLFPAFPSPEGLFQTRKVCGLVLFGGTAEPDDSNNAPPCEPRFDHSYNLLFSKWFFNGIPNGLGYWNFQSEIASQSKIHLPCSKSDWRMLGRWSLSFCGKFIPKEQIYRAKTLQSVLKKIESTLLSFRSTSLLPLAEVLFFLSPVETVSSLKIIRFKTKAKQSMGIFQNTLHWTFPSFFLSPVIADQRGCQRHHRTKVFQVLIPVSFLSPCFFGFFIMSLNRSKGV